MYQGAPKLIPHLYKHTNYVIHYRNLKYLEELGFKITKLHATISFQQTAWMLSYIEFNNNKRQKQRTISRNICKNLFHNSIFGKTCNDIKNRIELKLTTDHDRAIIWFNKLHFENNRCIDGLHMIEMFKQEVLYDRPSYIGTSIMDMSKLHMRRFHYEIIHKNFEGKRNLIYTDTDSLVSDIRHHDIYKWISQHREHFDLSDSKRPELHNDTNKKVVGKFKNETNSFVIKEFLALSPKS